MSRRVLLAESSEAIRGVAEPVLRQNGYEVVAVTTAQKALQVLEFSRPNLILAGAELALSGGQLFHERLATDTNLAHIPLILIVSSHSADPPLAEESLIRLPFEPNQLLQKVKDRIGATQDSAHREHQTNPLKHATLDDDQIDAALGLDRIEVTDSEVMDETTNIRRRMSTAEDMAQALSRDNLGESGRVESIVINEDQTDINLNKLNPRKPERPQTDSNKLDILSDAEQYALQNPDSLQPEGEIRDHDYEWFINEMKRDSQPSKSPEAPNTGDPDDSDALDFEDHASQTEGVSQYLDEFKREVKKLNLDQPDSLVLGAEENDARSSQPSSSSEKEQWVDSLETITGDQLEVFTREFARELAERVATKIVDKIDTTKLLSLIKSEIVARARRQSKV